MYVYICLRRAMKQSQEIKSFFYGQYFAEGVRITIGSILPVVICALMDLFVVGTVISFGALLVGLSDTPGPPHHRRTGMLACIAVCVFTFLVGTSVNTSFILMTVVLAFFSFVYSMFAVFNSRASTVGVMGMLLLLLIVDNNYTLLEEIQFLGLFLLGALWYMLISFAFTRVQPYRQAQQELAESIRFVAEFLRLKANFYDPDIDYDKNYLKVIEKQVEVHEHQEKVRELLFLSKRSIKDTTKIGRLLTLVFADIVDLFEQSMTTYYDYDKIRERYQPTGIMPHIKRVIDRLSHELDHYAYQLNANRMPTPLHDFSTDIQELTAQINAIEQHSKVNTIPLKKITVGIRKITTLLDNMYNYSVVNASAINKREIDDASKFIQTSHIDWKKFKSNLSLESSFFRHSLRMSVVMTLSFVVLHLLNFGTQGSFWVLVTILVILKPGFGLTKERNVQRLIGTLIGGIIGGLILLSTYNEIVLFTLMIIFFLFAYSLFRVNYILAVLFLTPYVIIMQSFAGENSLAIAQERILDTFVGGMIAFASGYVIFPNWESSKIKENIYKLLTANFVYFEQITKMLTNQPIEVTEYKLARKEVYIASANMGSTFQRMLTEPKWRQKRTNKVNKFVILNHILSSYLASLYTEIDKSEFSSISKEQLHLLKRIAHNLYMVITSFQGYETPDDWTQYFQDPDIDDNETEDSQLITEQLQFLLKISTDLQKATEEVLETDENSAR